MVDVSADDAELGSGVAAQADNVDVAAMSKSTRRARRICMGPPRIG
jgi:hypothetical protein